MTLIARMHTDIRVVATLRQNASYQMPWADIDAAIDANEPIASPALHHKVNTDSADDAAIETLNALTAIQRIDRRLQFADRFYTP